MLTSEKMFGVSGMIECWWMLLPLGWLIEFVLGCDSFFMFSFFIFLKMLGELVEDFDVFLSVEFPESLLLLPIVKISFLRLAAW